jgi:hypothetical protein
MMGDREAQKQEQPVRHLSAEVLVRLKLIGHGTFVGLR